MPLKRYGSATPSYGGGLGSIPSRGSAGLSPVVGVLACNQGAWVRFLRPAPKANMFYFVVPQVREGQTCFIRALSSAGERLVDIQEAGGSTPSAPTTSGRHSSSGRTPL